MIRALRIALARRAAVNAHAAWQAYQTQPADGGWHILPAEALRKRYDQAAARYARALCA